MKATIVSKKTTREYEYFTFDTGHTVKINTLADTFWIIHADSGVFLIWGELDRYNETVENTAITLMQSFLSRENFGEIKP